MRDFTHHGGAEFAVGARISGTVYDIRCRVPGVGRRGEIYRKACAVDLQQSVFFHSVSERVAADTEHASRLDLIAFGRIQGLLNKLFF